MPLVDHEDSVLIVIDAQHGFYGDRLPADESGRAREALDRMVWLAGVAARLGIPAVITEEDPKRNGPTSPAIAERLGQASALIKPTFGLTGTPEIVQAVEETGRKTAVLVGFETDVCVAQSAIGLRERGMRVVVPDDAVYSPGEMHARGIARMTAEGVEINHCKGLAYEWTRTLDRSREILGADGPGEAPFRLERSLVRVGWLQGGGGRAAARCRLGRGQSGDDGEDDARYQGDAEREPPGLAAEPRASCTSTPAAPPARSPLRVRRRPAAAEQRAHESSGGSEGRGIHPTSHRLVGDFGQPLDRGADRSGKSAEHQPDERTGGGVKTLAVGQRQPDRQRGSDDRPGRASPRRGEGDVGALRGL